MKNGICSMNGKQEASGLTPLLLVEREHLALLALAVVLVLLLDRLELRRDQLHAAHRADPAQRQRQRPQPHGQGQGDDRQPQESPTVSSKNLMIASARSTKGWKMTGTASAQATASRGRGRARGRETGAGRRARRRRRGSRGCSAPGASTARIVPRTTPSSRTACRRRRSSSGSTCSAAEIGRDEARGRRRIGAEEDAFHVLRSASPRPASASNSSDERRLGFPHARPDPQRRGGPRARSRDGREARVLPSRRPRDRALDGVALHGPADLAADRDPEANLVCVVVGARGTSKDR